MSFCPKCGVQIEDGTRFCPACGAEIVASVNPGPQQNNAGVNAGFTANNAGNTNTNNGATDFVNKNSTDSTSEFDQADIDANKAICGISYISILFFLPLVCCKNPANPTEPSKFGRFHANQALIVLLIGVIMGVFYSVVSGVLNAIFTKSYYGIIYETNTVVNIFIGILGFAVGIISVALLIFGLVNALSGKAKTIPFIGDKITIIK